MDVLRNLAKFTAKHLCQSLCQPQVCNFIKRETLAQVFSLEFCEFFFYRTPLGECFQYIVFARDSYPLSNKSTFYWRCLKLPQFKFGRGRGKKVQLGLVLAVIDMSFLTDCNINYLEKFQDLCFYMTISRFTQRCNQNPVKHL